jgi:hypothetical protein
MWRWRLASKREARADVVRRSSEVRKDVPDAVPELREALPLITAEFERARRYERTVTIAVFAVEPDGTGSGSSASDNGRHDAETGDDRSLPAVLASVVSRAMRETDLVACDGPGRRCIVVMPEIGPEEGRRAVSRMRQLCTARLRCAVRADIAVFPQDGWMFLDLVDVAQRHARSAEARRFVVPASDSAA